MTNNKMIVKGNIWTGDPDLPIADYFYVEDGSILYVGKGDNVPSEYSEAETLDFNNNLIIPGFSDSHIHLTAYSKLNMYPNLADATSIEEFGQMVRAIVKNYDEGSWIRCINFNEANWTEAVVPDRKFLDAVAPDNPVIISRYCGHTHVVNTKALEVSGLLDSSDPNLARDSHGILTGIINEGGAASIIDAVAEEYETPERMKEIIYQACLKLSSLGITSVHACDAPSYALGEDLAALQDNKKEERLPVRVFSYHDALPNYTFKSGFGDDKIAFSGFKLFTDGSLGGHTAALSEPYSDDPSTTGQLNHSDSDLEKMVTEAHKKGIQVQIHAIGDRALCQIVTVLENVILKNGKPSIPYRINHAIVCPPEIISRIANIGAIVDIQPVQAVTDRNMAPKRLGEKRMNDSYCYKSLLDAGIVLTGSSDAPIEDPNPWVSIWAAVCRCEPGGTVLKGFNPKEKLNIEEALGIYTVNPWKALDKDNEFGMIKKGFRADFSVINGNPLNMPDDELCKVSNKATFVDGKCVWKEDDQY